MLYIALSRVAVAVALLLQLSVAFAEDRPPRLGQDPVLGLRFEFSRAMLDPLPLSVQEKCSELVTEHVGRRLWVFGIANEESTIYYVVGGYFIRDKPRVPHFPKYESDNLGAVLKLQGDRCTLIGPAREVFDMRVFDETPQTVLQELASNFAGRLVRAHGGPVRFRQELHKQHVDSKKLPAELKIALSDYMK
jgi:hypothetical protein